MAKEDYRKFNISSLKDAQGNYSIIDYEKDLRAFVNQALKSALPEDAFYYVKNKRVSSQGAMSADFFVKKEYASAVKKAMQDMQAKLTFPGSDQLKYSVQESTSLTNKEYREVSRKENKEQSRQTTDEIKKIGGKVAVVLGALTAIVNITRRILSAVMTQATQVSKDMYTAHNLGMSYDAMRNYRSLEIRHGMKEGTVSEAITDIQNKFGNITSLDEKALESLAVVMGGKIQEMATMGVGNSNPEAVLGAILDSFNAQANAGYNSVGQYVGEQQARRELYSYLNKVSPRIADIFATMQEEHHNINSVYRGQADVFAKWKDLNPVNMYGNNREDTNLMDSLKESYDGLKTTMDELKLAILTTLAPYLLRLINWLQNARFFMSEEDNLKLNEKNRKLNSAELDAVNAFLNANKSKYDSMNPGDKAYYDTMLEYKASLEKANKGNFFGNVDKVVMYPEQIRVEAEKRLKAQATERNTEMLRYGHTDIPAPVPTLEEAQTYLSYEDIDLEKEKEAYLKAQEKASKKLNKKQVKATVNEVSKKAHKEFTFDEPAPFTGYTDYVARRNKARAQYEASQVLLALGVEPTQELLDKYVHVNNMNSLSYDVNLSAIKADYMSAPTATYDEEDFYTNWLWSRYGVEYEDRLTDLRAEKQVNDFSENSLYPAQFLLLKDNPKVSKTYAGQTGTVIATSTQQGNGEYVTRLDIVIKSDKGEKTKTLKLTSAENLITGSGTVGTAVIQPDGSLLFTDGTTASQESGL